MKKTFVAIFMVATALFSATNKEVEEYIEENKDVLKQELKS